MTPTAASQSPVLGMKQTEIVSSATLAKETKQKNSAKWLKNAREFLKAKQSLTELWESQENWKRFEVENIPLVPLEKRIFQLAPSGESLEHMDQLYEAATLASSVYKKLMEIVTKKAGLADARVADLKGKIRAKEKANDDYSKNEPGPPFIWLFDIVRASITCQTAEEIAAVVEVLKALEGKLSPDHCAFKIIRLKNRFKNPTPGGFRDLNLNIQISVPSPSSPSSSFTHICELQIHKHDISELAHAPDTHEQYEFFRTYFKGSDATVADRLKLLNDVMGLVKDRQAEDIGSLRGMVDYLIREAKAVPLTSAVVRDGMFEKMSKMTTVLEVLTELDLAIELEQTKLDLQRQLSQGDTLDQETLRTVIVLANLHYKSAQFNDPADPGSHRQAARQLYEEALQAYSSLGEAGSRNYLRTASNLASFLEDNHQLGEAEKTYREVLDRRSSDDIDNFTTKNNLATLLYKKTKLPAPQTEKCLPTAQKAAMDEARRLFEEVLRSRESEKSLGKEHVDTLMTINNLAVLLKDQSGHLDGPEQRQRLDEAREMFQRAMDGYEKTMGPDYPETLRTVGNLGIVLDMLGKLDEAEKMYKKAWAGLAAALGHDHEETLLIGGNYAYLLQKQANLYLTPPSDPPSVHSSSPVAVPLSASERLAMALEKYKAAVISYSKTLGPHHPDTFRVINNAGIVLHRQGKLAEAKEMYEEALKGREEGRYLDFNDPSGDAAWLNSRYFDLQSITTAAAQAAEDKRKQYNKKIDEWCSAEHKKLILGPLGPAHVGTLSSYHNLATVLEDLGKNKEAEEMYRKALAGRLAHKELGPSHSDTRVSMNNLASLLHNRGRVKEAEELLWKAVDGESKGKNDRKDDRRGEEREEEKVMAQEREQRIGQNYGHVLFNLGKRQEAEDIYARFPDRAGNEERKGRMERA